MSFRELRNFVERMKCLGYHRLISMENFRCPNFELVADILYWLAERLDPNCDLSDDISTESARVEFIKEAARILMAKANVRINVRKLYQADGYAVQELYKAAAFLFHATMLSKTQAGGGSGSESHLAPGRPLFDAKGVASGIIESGGQLYSTLGNEPQLKEGRDRAIRFIDEMSHNLESDDPQVEIEKSMRAQIQSLSDHFAMLKSNCAGLQSDRVQIQARIDRKQSDLDRALKRLKTIKKVKPAFMAEYESLETELKHVYHDYLDKFTNLSYLENEQRRLELQDEERRLESDRHLRKMRRHLREEELRILRGEQQVDENHIEDRREVNDDDGDDDDDQLTSDDPDQDIPVGRPTTQAPGPVRLARPGAADPRGRCKIDYPGAGNVIGSMLDDDDDDDSAEYDDPGQKDLDDDEMGSNEEEAEEEEDEDDPAAGDDSDF